MNILKLSKKDLQDLFNNNDGSYTAYKNYYIIKEVLKTNEEKYYDR